MGLFTSGTQTQGNNAYNQAFNTAGMFGGDVSSIGANLTPFLTQEMLHPQGIGQSGLSAEEAAATGGAGGANSAFQGAMAQRAAVNRNAGGFQAGMDEASRNAAKAGAGASERIASGNENLKQQQSQQGAAGLGSLYKTDTSGMLGTMGQEAPDIHAEIAGQQAGPAWMTQLNQGLGTFGNIGKTVAGIPGMTGWGG